MPSARLRLRYPERWKMRILRIFSSEMRLAVRLATAPDSNTSRAFAMSAVGVRTGTPTAEISRTGAPTRLFDLFRGPRFTLLLFDGRAATDAGYERVAATARQVGAVLGDDVRAYVVVPTERRPPGLDGVDVLLDPDRDAHQRYGATAESLYLVRPDGYIAFRSQPAEAPPVLDHLARLFTMRTSV